MGLSFLSLLYLQVSYIEEMMKTRKEQFDSAVRNSLDQVSKDVEYAETMRWLVEDISDAERKALTENNTSLGQNNVVRGTQRFQVKSRDGKIISDFELRNRVSSTYHRFRKFRRFDLHHPQFKVRNNLAIP